MRYLLFILISFFTVPVLAQFQVKGVIEQYDNKELYLTNFYGDQNKIIDSVQTDANGRFAFTFRENQATGQYRIVLENRDFFDFIFNKENIELITQAKNPMQNVNAVESLENDIFYHYLDIRSKSYYELSLLDPVIKHYPDENKFYLRVLDEYSKIQDRLYQYVDSLKTNYPNAFATRIALMEREPTTDPLWNSFEEQMFKRKHYFDQVDFSDTALLRSNVISTKIIGYLSLYQNKNLSKDQLEDAFKQAVDTILKVTHDYPLVYEFALDYLIGGFEQYGFDGVIEYIADHALLEEGCEYSENSSTLEQRIATLKKLANGNTAPDFTATDVKGDEIKLSESSGKKTLLVFWASWCPHCKNIIPGIRDYTNVHQNDLRVIAISVDTSKSDCLQYIHDNNLDWNNICDARGWNNAVAELYGIHATPTMILVDENSKIIGKPNNVRDLKGLLEK